MSLSMEGHIDDVFVSVAASRTVTGNVTTLSAPFGAKF